MAWSRRDEPTPLAVMVEVDVVTHLGGESESLPSRTVRG